MEDKNLEGIEEQQPIEPPKIEPKPKRKVNYVYTDARKEAFEKAKEKRKQKADEKRVMLEKLKQEKEILAKEKIEKELLKKDKQLEKEHKIVEKYVNSKSDESSSDDEVIIVKKKKKVTEKEASKPVVPQKKEVVFKSQKTITKKPEPFNWDLYFAN